jgi:superfamily II DNA/RNA helicase
VVATPGRLLNLIDEEVFNLDRVTYLVLDEVRCGHILSVA